MMSDYTIQMTASEFEKHTGRKPIQDDLGRVNCADAGRAGHSQCGWCYYHNGPKYACGNMCNQPANKPVVHHHPCIRFSRDRARDWKRF